MIAPMIAPLAAEVTDSKIWAASILMNNLIEREINTGISKLRWDVFRYLIVSVDHACIILTYEVESFYELDY